MDRHIWKFALHPEVQKVPMPRGAELLHIGVQTDYPVSTTETIERLCVWALVDIDAPMVPRRILVAGTGWPAPGDEARYVGTALMAHGSLVWHVFDGGEQ